ncbi:MAG: DUF4393 domain-containing protein [Candidatus Scalindua sp.]
MNDDNNDNSWSKDAKNIGIDKIAKEIYKDGLKEAVKETGKGLTVLAKAINVALSPLKGMVWSYEKIEIMLMKKLSNKLSTVSPDNIQIPPINIAGPAVEALRFTNDEPLLQEMFASLLATTMQADKQDMIHPAFVEIIKQLSGEEAKIINILNMTSSAPRYLVGVRVKEHPPMEMLRGNRQVHTRKNIVTASHQAETVAEDALFDPFVNYINENNNYAKLTKEIPNNISKKNISNLLRLEIIGTQTVNDGELFDDEGNYSSNNLISSLFITDFGKAFMSSCT